MKISELYSSVAKLGFEDTLEDNEAFFYAANRALLQINAIRPARAVHVINHRPLPNAIPAQDWSVVDVYNEVCYEATDAKAFYFEAAGTGRYVIEHLVDGEWNWVCEGAFATVGFEPKYGLIKKDDNFVTGTIRIRFGGEYVYSIRHVAMYALLLGPAEEDIPPFEQFTRYDMSVKVSDFLALSDKPMAIEGYERMSNGFDIENGRIIILPYEARGIYKITYNRRPRALVYENDPADDDTEIDLDEDLCTLMPLLVASYLCLDGEEAKAAHYLTLYQSEALNIERRARNYSPGEYKNVTGW